ncbi:MAG TPA: molecular chaperone HtpG [Steroidobacteraceae bacterium]|nr:molecular chaperone HtpG [Steroidobacteraceae bacterium]
MPETAAAPEKLAFKAEVRELLKLMIHSLYSHREIFLRELISNASDANDKLRFLALADPGLPGEEKELAVWVTADEKARTVAIRDNGIGMTREEAASHLGTIARSGTAEFFSKLTGNAQKDSQLIGQFGVGFYSAFIVADRVEVLSRKAGEPAEAGVRWSSAADGDFTIETIAHAQRGTTVILHLKEDAKEFADSWRLRSLVRRYSDHLAFPVYMPKTGEATLDFEAVNQAKALWTRPRTEVSDEEYAEFYRYISHDSEAPLAWSHNKVEGKREYTSLLYLPARAPFDLWQRDAARGLKLYVKRVFIMDDAEQFLPLYLRFIKGVVDSSDLPLNVSRELLQKDAEVEAMRSALTKRALELIGRVAKEDPEKYAKFWKEFGQVLKEGVAEDFTNREKLLPLLRFASTHEAGDEDKVSLADYVARMQPGQEKIYYVLAESRTAARGSPFIEQLRARKVEVLLLGDRVDPWIMGQLHEFDGKPFQDAARGELDLAKLGGSAPETADGDPGGDSADKALFERVAKALGDAVAGVKASRRLAESPACLTRGEDEMSEQMRRLLAAAGRGELPPAKPELELNMEHPLVRRLAALTGSDFDELAQLLYDQAQLTEQGQIANPGEYARRLNSLLLKLLGAAAG